MQIYAVVGSFEGVAALEALRGTPVVGRKLNAQKCLKNGAARQD